MIIRHLRTIGILMATLLISVGAEAEPLNPAQLRDKLNSAQMRVRRGDYEMAARVYRELMPDHIEDDRVVRGYAGALRSLARLDEALAALTRGDEHRTPPRFVRERVSILRQLGRNEDAMELCLDGLAASPGLEQLLRSDILRLAELPEIGDTARTRLSEMFAESPTPGIGETLIELLLDAGEFEQAAETVKRLDNEEPNRRGYRMFDVARRLGSEGAETEALELLGEMEARHPAAPQLREAALFRAAMQEKLGNPDAALENLTAYAAGLPSVDQRSYEVHLERARLLSGPLGRVDEALAIYDELLANDLLRPRHEDIRLRRAEVQLSLARYEGALNDFRELAGGSRSESVRERSEFLIGEIFFYEGELDSAAAVWARQVESFPKGSLANDALDRIFLFNENYGEDGLSLRNMGHVYRLETEGHLEAAAERADSLLAAMSTGASTGASPGISPHAADSETLTDVGDPIEDDLLLKAGSLWLGLGDTAKAMAYFDAVTTRHPESRLAPVAMMARGEILETELADAPEALAVYEDLIVKYPLSIEASEVRPRVTRLRKEVRS